MIRAVLFALLVAVSATSCGERTTTPTAQQRQLTNLHDIRQLQTAFNAASDEPRLIVLVSPT